MAPTSGFLLSALPRAPQVPDRIGQIDAREIYDTVRTSLATAEQARSATGRALLADEQIRTAIAENQAKQDVLPALTQGTITDTPNRSRLLAGQVQQFEATAPLNRRVLEQKVEQTDALAPITRRSLLARTATEEARAEIAKAESDPKFIEARMKRMLSQLSPTGVREFELLTRDLTPAEKERALKIHLGLAGRASGAAIQYKEVVGEDGRKRLVAVDPREVGAQVIGSGETYGSGVGATPAATAPNATETASAATPDGAVKPTGTEVFRSPTPQEQKAAETAGTEGQKLIFENRAKLPKARATLETFESAKDRVEKDIDEAIALVSPFNTGVAGALPLPMTEARKLAGLISTIKSNVGVDTLTALRQSSPTGGALGNVSDKDVGLLTDSLAKLDQLAKPKDLKEALLKVKEARREAAIRLRNAYERDVDAFGEKSSASQPETKVGEFKIVEVK